MQRARPGVLQEERGPQCVSYLWTADVLCKTVSLWTEVLCHLGHRGSRKKHGDRSGETKMQLQLGVAGSKCNPNNRNPTDLRAERNPGQRTRQPL